MSDDTDRIEGEDEPFVQEDSEVERDEVAETVSILGALLPFVTSDGNIQHGCDRVKFANNQAKIAIYERVARIARGDVEGASDGE